MTLRRRGSLVACGYGLAVGMMKISPHVFLSGRNSLVLQRPLCLRQGIGTMKKVLFVFLIFAALLSAAAFADPTPPSTSGMALWLSADSGVTMDGSNKVSVWADQSGNSVPREVVCP